MQTLGQLVNIDEMKRVLIKYNNSGLYKEKTRVPSACSVTRSARRSLEKKHQELATAGVVGVIGARITPTL